MHYQPGHPHGFCSAIWTGEIALCEPLHDPRAAIEKLKATALPYPQQLRDALIRRFQWEILFSIENADRALACIAEVLFALNGRYLINEKAALSEAAAFL